MGYHKHIACMNTPQVKKNTGNKNKKKGFTLLEVLVAISIVITAGFIPISFVSNLITENALTPNRLKAEMLAQEIIEHIRYKRDSDVLGGTGTNWFTTLYETGTTNPYRDCVVYADDWVSGSNNKYCRALCYNTGSGLETATGECTTDGSSGKVFNGFVSGVSTSGETRRSNQETCDGRTPKDNGKFSVTVNIVVPDEEANARYAMTVPCISWSNKNGVIKKVELQETIFEWVQRR